MTPCCESTHCVRGNGQDQVDPQGHWSFPRWYRAQLRTEGRYNILGITSIYKWSNCKNWQSPVSLNGNSSSSLHCIYSRHSCLHRHSHCQHSLPLLRQPALCHSLIGWGLIWVALWVHCSAQCTWKRFNYF